MKLYEEYKILVENKNVITVKLTLDANGLKIFKQFYKTYMEYHKEQFKDFGVGENVINVNNTLWGELKRKENLIGKVERIK